MRHRDLAEPITRDLAEKMVLVSGPRQSGKTTLTLQLLRRQHPRAPERYLSWDDDEARSRILAREFPMTAWSSSTSCTSSAAGGTSSRAGSSCARW
jgi:predicted AAA+ superfamily ATPase